MTLPVPAISVSRTRVWIDTGRGHLRCEDKSEKSSNWGRGLSSFIPCVFVCLRDNNLRKTWRESFSQCLSGVLVKLTGFFFV